jgi:hypothetical protein
MNAPNGRVRHRVMDDVLGGRSSPASRHRQEDKMSGRMPSTNTRPGAINGSGARVALVATLSQSDPLTPQGDRDNDDGVPLVHRPIALVLAALLFGLTPAAYADPPDPTWIGGYWDDDDFDDVVVFISSASAIVEHASFDAGPMLLAGERLAPASQSGEPTIVTLSACSRAPPVGFLPPPPTHS